MRIYATFSRLAKHVLLTKRQQASQGACQGNFIGWELLLRVATPHFLIGICEKRIPDLCVFGFGPLKMLILTFSVQPSSAV